MGRLLLLLPVLTACGGGAPGGTVSAAQAGRRAVRLLLSGPAGGVVGMSEAAHQAGFDSVIGFDMGGTSTDVSVYAGSFERTRVSQIAGTRLARPMLRINTVAAGGGSLLTFRGGRLQSRQFGRYAADHVHAQLVQQASFAAAHPHQFPGRAEGPFVAWLFGPQFQPAFVS